MTDHEKTVGFWDVVFFQGVGGELSSTFDGKVLLLQPTGAAMPNGIGPVPLESDILLCQFSVRFLPSRRPCGNERVSYENRPGTVAAISSVDDGSVFSGGGSVNAYARNDDEGVGSIWYRRKLAFQVQATSNPIAEDNGNRCIERSCLARGGRRAYRERDREDDERGGRPHTSI